MKYVTNSETGKRCFIAFENKCAPNVSIFKEIMVLRDEAARLLGYSTHAAFRIEEKMAKTPDRINDFISQVFADDMFYSAFEADPMIAEEGRQYRHAVLEKGGSQNEWKTLSDFLGNEPKKDAFHRALGIA